MTKNEVPGTAPYSATMPYRNLMLPSFSLPFALFPQESKNFLPYQTAYPIKLMTPNDHVFTVYKHICYFFFGKDYRLCAQI